MGESYCFEQRYGEDVIVIGIDNKERLKLRIIHGEKHETNHDTFEQHMADSRTHFRCYAQIEFTAIRAARVISETTIEIELEKETKYEDD